MTTPSSTPARRGAALRLRALAAAVMTLISGAYCDLPLAAPAVQEEKPNTVRSIVEGKGAPEWLVLPPRAQVVLPAGVQVEVVSSAIVSHDNRRQAALVGEFRNTGRALTGLTLTLAFLGPHGESVLWSSPDEAEISEVATNGTLPFRFPLVPTVALPGPMSILRVTLDEAPSPRAQAVEARVIRHSAKRVSGDATVISGEIEVVSAAPPAGPLRVAVLLLDRDELNLDLFAGDATPLGDKRYRFELHGTLPVASRTRSLRVWAQTSR